MDSWSPILLSVTICYYHYLFWCSFVPNWTIRSLLKQVSVSFWHVLMSLWALMFSGTRCFRVVLYSACPALESAISPRRKVIWNQDVVLSMFIAVQVFLLLSSSLGYIEVYVAVEKYIHFTCVFISMCLYTYTLYVLWVHTDKSGVHTDSFSSNPAIHFSPFWHFLPTPPRLWLLESGSIPHPLPLL